MAWDKIPFNEEVEQVARHCRAVCFGSLAQRNVVSRETIQRFLNATPPGCLKIFDINLRQQFYTKEVIQASLRRCNVLKINDEELVLLGRFFDFVKKVLSFCPKSTIVLGKKYYRFPQKVLSFLSTSPIGQNKSIGCLIKQVLFHQTKLSILSIKKYYPYLMKKQEDD